MLNNDSVISLSRSRVQVEPKERVIVFTDIGVYLSKVSKNKQVQGDNKNNIFKLAVSHISQKDMKQNYYSVSQIMNEINEKLITKIEKIENSKNIIMNKKSLMYSSLEKADGEVRENLYNCVLTTDGDKVTDFTLVPAEVQLLVLANTSRQDLIQKLINHKEKEQK